MPLTPEEPQIYESVPGPRVAAGTTRTPQASRPASPIPGPRPASSGPRGSDRPAAGRTDSKGPTPGRPGNPRNSSPQQSGEPAAAEAPTAEIELVSADDATAVEAADDAVDKLLDAGRAPGEVLVLTTGDEHPWAQHELTFGEDSYWGQLADGEDVFCVEAAAVSRLPRRPVVVLAVNGGTDTAVSEALPAAVAKASAKLIVCGDPKRLSALL